MALGWKCRGDSAHGSVDDFTFMFIQIELDQGLISCFQDDQ